MERTHKPSQRQSQRKQLVEIGCQATPLSIKEDGDILLIIEVSGRDEKCLLWSKGFREWLQWHFIRKTGKRASSRAISQAVNALCYMAVWQLILGPLDEEDKS